MLSVANRAIRDTFSRPETSCCSGAIPTSLVRLGGLPLTDH